MATPISDRPIELPSEEMLGRSDFSTYVANQIINSPDHGSLRIGVYGSWGEGKTSILHLIKMRL